MRSLNNLHEFEIAYILYSEIAYTFYSANKTPQIYILITIICIANIKEIPKISTKALFIS